MALHPLFKSLIFASSLALAGELSAAPRDGGTIVLDSGGTHPALIELFTSEGCSSCPPAEAWLSALKDRPNLWTSFVPVAFHVDYWDNLGWPDKFASATYTDRQRTYAARWRSDTVYTPEIVLNGHEWRDWHADPNADSVAANNAPEAGRLHVEVTNDPSRSAKVTYSGKLADGSRICVAWLGMDVRSSVRAGENSGRDLVHDFVVIDFQTKPAAAEALTFTGTSTGRPADPQAISVWVEGKDGNVVQALGGKL